MTSEQSLVELLAKYKLKITTAESCTGGLVAATLINVPGVSAYLKAGYITYSDKAKHRILGVRKKTLKKFSAVSDKVAAEMAKGAAKLEKADVAIAVTGLAGPDGGTEKKPVGLVYIGIYVRGKVRVKECRFDGDRESIRHSSVAEALRLTQKMILKSCGE
ncbi:MAG: CinA family protein [Lachnospiraceae bacterium]|nr:CinA family protein [Lachnospiraceae bacterium]